MKKLFVITIAVLMVVAMAIPSMAGLTVTGRIVAGIVSDGTPLAIGSRIDAEHLITNMVTNSKMLINLSITSPSSLVKVSRQTNGFSGTFTIPDDEMDNKISVFDLRSTPLYFKYTADGGDYDYSLWQTTNDPMQLVHRGDFAPFNPWKNARIFNIGGTINGVNIFIEGNDSQDVTGDWETNRAELCKGVAAVFDTNLFGVQVGYYYGGTITRVTADHDASPYDSDPDETLVAGQLIGYYVQQNNEIFARKSLGIGNLSVAYADYVRQDLDANSNLTGTVEGDYAFLVDLSGTKLGDWTLNNNLVARTPDFAAKMAQDTFTQDSVSPIAFSGQSTVDKITGNPARYAMNYADYDAAGNGWFNKYVQNWQLSKYTYSAIPDHAAWSAPGKLRLFTEAKGKVDLFGFNTNLTLFNIYATGYGDNEQGMYDAIGALGDFKAGSLGVKFNAAFIQGMSDTDFMAIPILIDTDLKLTRRSTWSNNLHLLNWEADAKSGLLFDITSKYETTELMKGMTNMIQLDLPMGEDEDYTDRFEVYGGTLRTMNEYKFKTEVAGIPLANSFAAYYRINQLGAETQSSTMIGAAEIKAELTDKLSLKVAGAYGDTDGSTVENNPDKTNEKLFIARWGWWNQLDYVVNDTSTFSVIFNKFRIFDKEDDSATGYKPNASWEDRNDALYDGIENFYMAYTVNTADYGWELRYGKFPISNKDDWKFGKHESWHGRFFATLMEPNYYDDNGEKYKEGYIEESSFFTRPRLVRFKAWVKF